MFYFLKILKEALKYSIFVYPLFKKEIVSSQVLFLLKLSFSQIFKNEFNQYFSSSTPTGPLSGIFRILDSPRAMKRIQDVDKGPREKKVEPKPPTPVAPVQVKTTAPVQPARRPPTARQVSEDDEIARIKRENKAAGSSTTPAATETPAARKTPPSTEETPTEVSQVLSLNLAVKVFPSLLEILFPNVYDPYV